MSAPSNYVPALGYRWLTPLYDSAVRWTTRERTFKRALLAQARLTPGLQVLDLACGTGTLSVWAKQAVPGTHIYGVDGDREVLGRARDKAERAGVEIEFQSGLADQLPYSDASFDRILCSLFFHHLDADGKRRAFAEARRVLNPGGELHVADWGKAANPLMRLAFYGIQLLDGFPNTADNVEGGLPEFMRAAGFQDVAETRQFSTMWGTLSLYRANAPK